MHHDFAHYVVETTLGFENAFFGLVAKGYDIPDFSEPKAQRPFEIPEEAMNTEPIVALLQADLPNTPYPQDTNSNGLFREHSATLPVNITDEQLKVMRQKLRTFLQQWHDLQPGESMTLQFKV